MSTTVDRIVEAVLYEGYILYPYRATTAKNRQRFTFGRVYPKVYHDAQQGAEPFRMQVQCLVEGGDRTGLELDVRFLQPIAREVGRYRNPIEPADDPTRRIEPVPSLKVGDRLYQTWQEAVERRISIPAVTVEDLTHRGLSRSFEFEASQTDEPVRHENGETIGRIRRRGEHLKGVVHVEAEAVAGLGYRVTVSAENQTPAAAEDLKSDNSIVLRTFASTHVVLRTAGGAFVSLMDPPGDWAEVASSCENVGVWPVLVGDEGVTDTVLASPIILYDYPEIAAESAGELFDGTEIDEILTLRVMTMTDEEKIEMAQVDDRARRILARTESLSADDLMKMHGTIRERRSLRSDEA